MTKCCCAPGCSNREGRDTVSFYRFPGGDKRKQSKPRVTDRRNRWIAALRRVVPYGPKRTKEWEPSPNDRLCSAHFISGKKSDDPQSPDYIPTIFVFTKCTEKKKAAQALQQYNRQSVKRRKTANQKQNDEATSQKEPIKDISEMSSSPISNLCEAIIEDVCDSNSDTCSITSGMMDYETVHNAEIIHALNLECQNLRQELDECKDRLSRISLNEESFKDEEKLKYYTGLPSLSTLISIVQLIAPSLRSKCLSPFQQLLLTLMRLRLNLQIKDLGYRFSIHFTTAYKIFSDVIDSLYVNFVPTALFWPGKDELKKCMPKSFKEALPNCIGIIDSFEISINRSKDVKHKEHSSMSNHKIHETVKFIIAVTPQGSVTFVSNGWEGHTSAKHIAEQSDLLRNFTSSGDVLLAHRDEIIDSGALYQCTEPPPELHSENRQVTTVGIKDTTDHTSQRIHGKRVIGALRSKFTLLQEALHPQVLQKDPQLNVTVLDKFVSIACALLNKCPSVVPVTENNG